MMQFVILAQKNSPGPQYKNPGLFDMLVPLVLMFIIMYVILIKPQQKKQKQQQDLIKMLKAGDRVVTNGGIHGTITAVKENTVLLRVADNVKIEINRGNIAEISEETKKDKK
jgi:preprotein translocase subunit YajC